MKKTIIAMAALAASGMVVAQVTVTGTLAMGYKATKAPSTNAQAAALGGAVSAIAYSAGAEASGLGVDTSQININAKEDLGGGQSIEMKMSLAGADRSGESNSTTVGGVTGRDAVLSYTNTAFGRIQLGSEEGSAVHSGIPSADAPVIDMDGKLFQLKSSSDFISYAVPIGPIVFVYKLSESSKSLGLGSGFQGNAGSDYVGQRTTDYAIAYGAGAIKVVGAYRSYDNRDSNGIFNGNSLTKDYVYNLQFGYDLGNTKLGLGYQLAKASVGPQVVDMLVGVSFPVGSLTLGATYGISTVSGVADTPSAAFNGTKSPLSAAGAAGAAATKVRMQQADGSASGYSLGARYDLSKRTNVLVRYANWVRSGYEQFEAQSFGYGDRASETSILLVHNF